MSPAPLAWAVGAGVGLAGLAWGARRGWLTTDGLVAAAGVGTVLLVAGGPGPVVALVAFYAAASATGWIPAGCARPDADVTADSGRGRRGVQVLANGGVAAGAAVLGAVGLLPHAGLAVAGAIAAATADTLATEVGTARGGATVRLPDFRPVEPGSSGGVSAAGTAAGAAGAVAIGVWSAVGDGWWVAAPAGEALAVAAAVTAGGLAGSVADSLAGAWLEGRVPGVDNESVNLAATAVGAAAAALLGG